MTLREFWIVVEAASLRDARIAWQQAQYARFAYHSPNDMPEAPDIRRAIPKEVEDEIRAIRREVKVAFDTKRSRKQHGS